MIEILLAHLLLIQEPTADLSLKEAAEMLEAPAEPIDTPSIPTMQAPPSVTSTPIRQNSFFDQTSTPQENLGTNGIEKEVVYKKVTDIDLSGATVEGEGQLPSDFFVYRTQNPNATSLLNERLKFSFSDYNKTGF